MQSVKLLKPYYIKLSVSEIRIILAYQYFSLLINNEVFHFIPTEGKEIRVNRTNGEINNLTEKFAFKRGDKTIYMTMEKLISLKGFMNQLDEITAPYFVGKDVDRVVLSNELIQKLEQDNIYRMIDHALDTRDKEAFEKLYKLI